MNPKLDSQPRPGLEEQIRAGQVGSLLNLTDLELVNRYQRIAVEESRLGIPLIVGADVIHGFRTVFPIPLAEACTCQFGEPFKSRHIDAPNEPLFPFGYGLSYTTYSYRDLHIETPIVGNDDTLMVSAVVQLYVRDLVGSVTRPVKELKGFQRITLQPGEERTVRFDVPAGELGCIGLDMRYTVEPGAFKVWVGPDSTSGLEGHFEARQDL